MSEPRRIPVTPAQMARIESTQQSAAIAQQRAADVLQVVLLGTLTEDELARAEILRTVGDGILVNVPDPDEAD